MVFNIQSLCLGGLGVEGTLRVVGSSTSAPPPSCLRTNNSHLSGPDSFLSNPALLTPTYCFVSRQYYNDVSGAGALPITVSMLVYMQQ